MLLLDMRQLQWQRKSVVGRLSWENSEWLLLFEAGKEVDPQTVSYLKSISNVRFLLFIRETAGASFIYCLKICQRETAGKRTGPSLLDSAFRSSRDEPSGELRAKVYNWSKTRKSVTNSEIKNSDPRETFVK
jgi:hypothetical protein